MKLVLNSVVLAAFAVMGSAKAGYVTVQAGSSTSGAYPNSLPWVIGDLVGSATLSLSPALVAALSANGIQVASVSPAVLDVVPASGIGYASISVQSPVASVSGDLEGNMLHLADVAFSGGILQTAENNGASSTGGALSLTNLRFDLSAQRIYADISGANGVGLKPRVHLWNAVSSTGSNTLGFGSGGEYMPHGRWASQFTGLSITGEAFEYFTRSLGLTQNGISTLDAVADLGSIDAEINAQMLFLPVPEPATYALMAIGLLTAGMTGRRAGRLRS